jgi:general secretion pathway protein M
MSETTDSLKAQLAPLKAKWEALQPRERQMLMGMGWALGLVLIFMVGVRPAWRTLQQAPEQIKAVDTVLDDMRRQAEEVKVMRALPPVPPAQAQAALQSATERLGEGAHLRVQTDRAVVTLTKVSGAQLAQWLSEVRSSARVRPIEASLTQVSTGIYSGTVTVVLSAPSALNR